MTAIQRDKISAHDKLINAARVLFYNYGITATGIDAIVKRAGVAKKSLYNNFSSKDELIAAYLAVRHQEWLDLYQKRAALIKNPREGVMAVFDAYADHAGVAYEAGFRGCGLLNAAAELPAGAPGRQAIRQHKEEIEAILKSHLCQLVPDPQRCHLLARHLAFLLEGSASRAGLEGNSACVLQAGTIAKALVEAL